MFGPSKKVSSYKNGYRKVVYIFWFDNFQDLVLGPIIDGAQGGEITAKLFAWSIK